MIRAVIFDFNGVLVDDERVHFALFREVLAGRGRRARRGGTTTTTTSASTTASCFEAALADAGQAGRPRPRSTP